MEVLEAIKTRRSIRVYEDKPVEKEVIEKLVSAAAFAPSWKNSQTARYIAVTDKALKDKVAKDCVMEFGGNTNSIDSAPVLMVITTVNSRSGYERDGSFSTSKETHWQSFDAGIATQTFCLAAHEAGLGTVIMGIYDEKKVIDALNIPEGQSVSALVALGYPAENPEAPKRKGTEQLLSFI